MARLEITDRRLTVELEWWEKLAAHRSDLSVPLRAVTGVEVLEDVFADPAVARGERVPATRIRGVTVTGTFDAPDAPDAGPVFAVCHGTTGRPRPGVAVDLEGVTVGRIVVSTPDAEEYAQRLRELAGLADADADATDVDGGEE